MKDNHTFEELLSKFYENGLLKEVYRSEKALVCNVLDQFYLAFSLEEMQRYTSNYPGYVMLKASGLLEILRNENFVNEYSKYLTKELKSKLQIRLNDDSFDALVKLKCEFAQEQPPCRLDLTFEQEVMEKGKAVIKGLRWNKYFLRFLCEKQNPAIELLPLVKGNKAFEELLCKFYENGLLKEVYRSERAVVCNVFNQYYIAIPLDFLDLSPDGYVAYVMNSKGLRTILEDDDYILHHYKGLSEEMKEKSLAILDENLFRHMLEHKAEYAQRPTRESVDLAFEQEVMEKGKAALE